MAKKNNELTVRGFVPDGNGGLRSYEELSEEEKDAFGKKIVERMGRVLNDYFSIHPEAYAKY
ncbi:MAG: hypothetical protein IJK23_05705 [Clostridia bacterium]|nr:hypothetical protein [Clostridia bacterium]